MRRFLIDTASDDAVALLMALRSPDVHVEAITVVVGNVLLEPAVQNAFYTVELCGKQTPVNDLIYAGFGEDVVAGRTGDDTIYGGPGNDLILGHRGDDTIYGGDETDEVYGKADNDILYGGDGRQHYIGRI